MALYLIGLGLESEKDITLKALEIIKSCKEIYLENYTSKLPASKKELEKFYKKKITLANRNLIENKFTEIIIKAKKENIALLIPGSPLAATTHISIFQEAKLNKTPIEILDSASILTAVGITGLSLYNFGKIASIPFDTKKITTPTTILKNNQKSNLHTLLLLDLDNQKKHYLKIPKAIEFLTKNKINKETKAIACARLGAKNAKIISGTLEKLKNKNFGKPPYCLIIPAKTLHFLEEEMFQFWR